MNGSCILYDFYAHWCKPCQKYDIILPEIAEEYGFKIQKVNVEDDKRLAEELQIEGLPTLAVVQDGVIKGLLTGAYPKDRLIVKLGEMLGYPLLRVSGRSHIIPVEEEYKEAQFRR